MLQNVGLQVVQKVELSSTFLNITRQVVVCDMSNIQFADFCILLLLRSKHFSCPFHENTKNLLSLVNYFMHMMFRLKMKILLVLEAKQ